VEPSPARILQSETAVTQPVVIPRDVAAEESRGAEVADARRQVAAAGGTYRCAGCGYAVTVRREVVRCPMCGARAWVEAPVRVRARRVEVPDREPRERSR
jgi:DNA-directed RNA polymerase subunit RPC12/RpoP